VADTELARRLIEHWLEPADVGRIDSLTGGFVNQVFRVRCDDRSYVLRIYRPDADQEAVAWEHRLTAALSEQLSFVARPIETIEGARTIACDAGGCAALWEYVEGTVPDPTRTGDRILAARMLGRFARAARSLTDFGSRPGWPAWVELDWRQNRWWHWPSTTRVPISREQADMLHEHVRTMPKVLSGLRELDLAERPVHGDFAPQNLLIDSGSVSALLDFDECRLDWQACDVADATWAFCRRGDHSGLDRATATEFLDEYYSAYGEIVPHERDAIPRLIRARRLWEALFDLGDFQRGYSTDLSYFTASLRALESVAGIQRL
jgi:Ser/Thr protein kinase RdoA (MazF antagonist)